jgi:hypothetical protein
MDERTVKRRRRRRRMKRRRGEEEEEEKEEAVSSCLEIPASILHIKNYFRQNMRNKWHNIKIIFIKIITSKTDF